MYGGSDSYGGDGRRGGGKRAFEDEDERYGGGYKRSRYDNGRSSRGDDRHGRRDGRYGDRGALPPAESDRARAWRLAKKAVVELGEAAPLSSWLQGTALRDSVSRAAGKVLAEMEQDPQHAKLGHLTALVLRAVTRLAHKTTLYAALAGQVNAKQPEFGRRLLEDAVSMLQSAVDAFDTEKAAAGQADSADAKAVALRDQQLRIVLIVRFLAELVAVRLVRTDDVLGLLDSIQAVCTPDDFNSEAESSTSLRAREHAAAWKDFYACVVLDALVHSGPSLASSSQDLYESLLSRCKEYISNREEDSNPRGIESAHGTSWLVRRLRLELLWEPENDEEQAAFCAAFDPLTLYWKALEQLRADAADAPPATETDDMNDGAEPSSIGVTVPGVLSVHEIAAPSRWKLVEPHPLSASLAIEAGNFDVENIPPYAPLFRVLTEDSGAAGAAIANLPLASYLTLRGDFDYALETSYPKPAMAAKMLLSLCSNVNARFASAPSAMEVRSEFLLVETLLVKALSETAPATLAYDCAVLAHLVKSDARVISPALAIVVELLFRELPTMRAGSRDAFVLLFSHFLSNFEYKWPWTHWAHVLEAEEDDAQRLFVSAVIERCVRLSYLQHMQTVLPTDFHMLLPPSPQPRIRFRTNQPAGDGSAVNDGGDVDPLNGVPSEEKTLSELYTAVVAKLKTHPPALALQTWLFEETEQRGVSREDALEVVWTCILEAGAATYTHMRLLLEKYSQAEQLRGGDEDELVLVRTVASVWLKSPQHIALILNAMLRHGVLRPTTIVQWVFTPDTIQQYSWPYVWGVVDDTLAFVQTSIAAAKAAESADGDKKMDGEDDDDAVAKRESELREMTKTLFEGFNRVISAHKTQCDAEGVNYQDNWFASALTRMQSVGRVFRVPLEDVASELEANTFNSNAADHDARKVFQLVWDSYRSS